MGNIPGSGHRNLPVTYFCMQGSAGASQPVFSPQNSPMAFGEKKFMDTPAAVQQTYVPSDVRENIKIDNPFKNTAFKNDDVSFAAPFSSPQNTSAPQANSASGLSQPLETKTTRGADSYRQVRKEWKSAETFRKTPNTSGIFDNASNSANSNANTFGSSMQGSTSQSSYGENFEPDVEVSGERHLTFEDIIDSIKEGRFKKIVTVGGAAFSASAGILHYRSPQSHLHHRISHKLHLRPEDLFHKDFFEAFPHRFIDLFKDLLPEQYKPTTSHYFIKLLESKGMLLRHYTQNVDNLDRMAGISLDKLVEAHGSFRLQHCSLCRVRYYYSWWREQILSNTIPRCKQCRWFVLPDVVFLGNQLPREFYTSIEADYRVADLLIIMGTPLNLQPFAFFYNNFKNCPRLVINRESIEKDYLYMHLFGYAQRTREVNFNPSKNYRDVLWIGECDEACEIMADRLGWKEDLHTLKEEGHKNLMGKIDVFDENLKS